jgi:hypothetical protein
MKLHEVKQKGKSHGQPSPSRNPFMRGTRNSGIPDKRRKVKTAIMGICKALCSPCSSPERIEPCPSEDAGKSAARMRVKLYRTQSSPLYSLDVLPKPFE